MFQNKNTSFYLLVIFSATFLIGGMITAPVVSKIYAESDSKFLKKENVKIQYDKKHKDKHYKYKHDKHKDKHHKYKHDKHKDKHHKYKCYDKHYYKYKDKHHKHKDKHHKYKCYDKHHDKHYKDHKYYKDDKHYKYNKKYHKY